ncbi:MAG: hypothetical protein NZ699_16245 [Roseiflexus sp.]|nr:hypothetical protein [Roseiflexus sp.]MCS7290673.1 hypothetical protein [Roseiflexus sp.]MDW8145443.1 hypothetical protein [Roseiflexaceae bacterium]MDW8232219.1 hypothetical protein [Roseiflexaceae bacterium]
MLQEDRRRGTRNARTIARFIGASSAAAAAVQALILLTIGGTVVMRATTEPGAPPAPDVTLRQPMVHAAIPLVIALLALAGFVRDHMPSTVLGSAALVIVGMIFLFGLGARIAGFGLIALLAAMMLSHYQPAKP